MFFSSIKSVKGLESEISEDCDLKLCLSKKVDFVRSPKQECINNEIEGKLLLKYLYNIYFWYKYVLVICINKIVWLSCPIL